MAEEGEVKEEKYDEAAALSQVKTLKDEVATMISQYVEVFRSWFLVFVGFVVNEFWCCGADGRVLHAQESICAGIESSNRKSATHKVGGHKGSTTHNCVYTRVSTFLLRAHAVPRAQTETRGGGRRFCTGCTSCWRC